MKYPTPHPSTVRNAIEAIDAAIRLRAIDGVLDLKEFSHQVAGLMESLAAEVGGDNANAKDLLEPLWAELVRRAPRLTKEVLAEVLKTNPEDSFEVQVEAAKKMKLPEGEQSEEYRQEFIDTVLTKVFKEGNHSYFPMTPYSKEASASCLKDADDWVLLGTWSVVTRAVMDIINESIAAMTPNNDLVH